jgi:hypothetical protein
VAAGRFVKGRADHLGLRVALHFSHFFGPLVDQQDDDLGIRVIVRDGVGHFLQQHGLAGARRSDHEHALSEADRCNQIDDAHVQFGFGRFEEEPPVRVQRRQVLEIGFFGDLVRALKVDCLDPQQREVAFTLLGRANLAGDDVPVLQAEAANL